MAAAIYLMCKGYRILAWRYKTKSGEVDLVAVRGGTVLFVEVKARADRTTGLEAVTPKAQARILRAAEHFMQRRPRYKNYVWRFDAVIVTSRRLPYHLKDAWRA
jgi:putative endonuclease